MEYSTFMVHPELEEITGVWLAHEPFHIRQGFVNGEEAPLGSGIPPDFDVEVYVTRRQGPPLADGPFELDQTYRFTSDYLVRVASDSCGPGFREQTEPLPCDEFVHEFPDGLPPGRYDIWVEWRAPCSAWTAADVCDDPDSSLTLFARAVDFEFFHDDFRPDDAEWPFDPWGVDASGTDP
ncbi:MAG: hypothetical protein ACE5MI_02995 [Acidimicrobiia bacterium]